MSKAVCVRRANVEPFAFGDLQIWDYKMSGERGSSIALVQVKPSVSHGLARSTRSEKYYYVLSGMVEFEVGRISYWVTQGDLLVIPRGEWFDYRNSGRDMATMILMHTPPFNLEDEEFAGERKGK